MRAGLDLSTMLQRGRRLEPEALKFGVWDLGLRDTLTPGRRANSHGSGDGMPLLAGSRLFKVRGLGWGFGGGGQLTVEVRGFGLLKFWG